MAGTENYQHGILHLAHLLVSADGNISEKERCALAHICKEEKISEALVRAFVQKVAATKESDLYSDGIAMLNKCSEEEKLCAFVHLYRLAEADAVIHIREVRFLLYGIKSARLEFDDVVLAAQLSGA